MEIKTSMQKLVNPYTQQVQKQQAENQQDVSKAAQPSVTGDRVSVSSQAKLYTEAYSTALNASEIREDKVAALKAQVESGTYQADSKKIAEKLLQSDLLINQSLEG